MWNRTHMPCHARNSLLGVWGCKTNNKVVKRTDWSVIWDRDGMGQRRVSCPPKCRQSGFMCAHFSNIHSPNTLSQELPLWRVMQLASRDCVTDLSRRSSYGSIRITIFCSKCPLSMSLFCWIPNSVCEFILLRGCNQITCPAIGKLLLSPTPLVVMTVCGIIALIKIQKLNSI